MRILLFAFIVMLCGCSHYDLKTDKGRANSPADSMGSYNPADPCPEKDPVTKRCL